MNEPLQAAPIWAAQDPDASAWAELLSTSPTIIQTFFGAGFPLGAASAIGPALRDRPVQFLIMMMWTIEEPWMHEDLARKAAAYLADHPQHRLTFLRNTPLETQLMDARGFNAVTINHNCLIDDAVFRPIPEIPAIYDAVYNARLSADKRPELAGEVERLALIYYTFGNSAAEFHALHASVRALMPKAHFVNELTANGCQWLSGAEVNKVYAQSRIGLCLSAVEGAMRASIEYLFAGLAVVSTPSLGGRDYFFDDEFCIIAEPDPRSIREAVDALIARNVPRDYVRKKTLARVDLDRRRYIDLVQGLIDEAGGTLRFEDRFWQFTRGETIIHWRSMKEFSETAAAALRERG
jgi:hypothetical protein